MSEILIIDKIKKDIKPYFETDSSGHDYSHILRVYNMAMKIAAEYKYCDKKIVALAALLHDIDDDKLFKTKNYANAKKIMKQNNISQSDINTVIEIISKVSFRKGESFRDDEIEGQIVQDADRLDAIGAIGIARAFAYGGSKGRSIFSSIDHFTEKLFLLKDLMNTPAAKRIAKNRHFFMVEFYHQFELENKALS